MPRRCRMRRVACRRDRRGDVGAFGGAHGGPDQQQPANGAGDARQAAHDRENQQRRDDHGAAADLVCEVAEEDREYSPAQAQNAKHVADVLTAKLQIAGDRRNQRSDKPTIEADEAETEGQRGNRLPFIGRCTPGRRLTHAVTGNAPNAPRVVNDLATERRSGPTGVFACRCPTR